MGGTVSFEKYKQRKEEEREIEFERYMAESAKKRDADFRKRYGKVFEGAPDIPVARVKYFCRTLLKLVPLIAEGDWEQRYCAYDDFCNIYVEGVDLMIQDWCRFDQRIEKIEDSVQSEYPFLKLRITKGNMKLLLTITLGDILSATPEAGDAAEKDFLWKLTRLFEIYRGVMYIFIDEIWERCEADMPCSHEQP